MGHRLSHRLKSCLQGSGGQEIETLPGAWQRSHKAHEAVNAGEHLGSGSWHIMSPPGKGTRVCACHKGHAPLDTLSTRSGSCRSDRDCSNSLRCVPGLYTNSPFKRALHALATTGSLIQHFSTSTSF